MQRIDGADGAVAESGDIKRPMEGEVISSGPIFFVPGSTYFLQEVLAKCYFAKLSIDMLHVVHHKARIIFK